MTRVILLGASNITLGFDPVSRLIRNGLPAPLDVRAALGNGRSFGAWSSILGRGLPPILDCSLWDEIAAAPPAGRTLALLTDVGNDLMYGYQPDCIAGWVETCLHRLRDLGAETIVTRLPMARAAKLGKLQYHTFRTLFFPFHPALSLKEVQRRADELDARVALLADQVGAAVVVPPAEWYAVDPIHIRWSLRQQVWGEIFSLWPGFEAKAAGPGLPLIGKLASRCTLLGREQRTPQPVYTADDVCLSLY